VEAVTAYGWLTFGIVAFFAVLAFVDLLT